MRIPITSPWTRPWERIDRRGGGEPGRLGAGTQGRQQVGPDAVDPGRRGAGGRQAKPHRQHHHPDRRQHHHRNPGLLRGAGALVLKIKQIFQRKTHDGIEASCQKSRSGEILA